MNVKVTDSIVGILRIGILRIRSYSSLNRPDLCHIESNHIHNLPQILKGCDVGLIEYYYNIEKKCFLESLDEEEKASAIECYNSHWQTIENYLAGIV